MSHPSVLRCFRMTTLVAAVALLCARFRIVGPAQKSQPITLDSSITIVESADEPGPVRARHGGFALAISQKWFGQRPALATVTGGFGSDSRFLIAEHSKVHPGINCATPTGPESLRFFCSARAGEPATEACRVPDRRGHARHHLCDYQFFADLSRRGSHVSLGPTRSRSTGLRLSYLRISRMVYPSPVFRYRGFFPNDEDLLTGWIPAGKGEQTGISLKVWDNVYETILRLKGNHGRAGYVDLSRRCAGTRGHRAGPSIVNQHHAIPLGVNVARWPRDVPYNFSTHPEILERAWTNTVAAYKPDEEILWSVGLRGLSDSSYASLDPSVARQRSAAWAAHQRRDCGADEDRPS